MRQPGPHGSTPLLFFLFHAPKWGQYDGNSNSILSFRRIVQVKIVHSVLEWCAGPAAANLTSCWQVARSPKDGNRPVRPPSLVDDVHAGPDMARGSAFLRHGHFRQAGHQSPAVHCAPHEEFDAEPALR